MRAGTLRHRLVFTRPLDNNETTQNSYGEDTHVNEYVGTFWCQIEALAGRELEAAQQRWAEARYKITLRKQAGVTFTRKMQAWWGSPARIFDILDVQDLGGSLRPSVTMLAKDYEG